MEIGSGRGEGAPARWTIVGAGRIARIFAAKLCARADTVIVGVHSRTPASALALATDVGCSALETLDDVARSDADVVYVATPHAAHAAGVRAAVATGRVVLCEKPLAMSVAETAELYELADAHDATLLEAMPFRFHPFAAEIAQIVGRGTLGDELVLEAEFGFRADAADPRLFDPVLGGGVLRDIGCYPLSLAALVATAAAVPIEGGRAGTLAVDPTWDGDGRAVEVETTVEWRLRRFRATFVVTLLSDLANTAKVVGSRGELRLNRPWGPDGSATLEVDSGGASRVIAPADNRDSHDFVIDATCAAARGVASHANPREQAMATATLLDRCLSAAAEAVKL